MKQTSSHGETGIQMQDGDDFVCPNCGCEIRLVHHGDPAKMPNMQMFTCCCGTRMEKEQRGAEPGCEPRAIEGGSPTAALSRLDVTVTSGT